MYCTIDPIKENWIGKQYILNDYLEKETKPIKSVEKIRDHIEKEFNYGEQLTWYRVLDKENNIRQYYGFPYDTYKEQSKDLKKLLKQSNLKLYKAWTAQEE